MGRVLRHGLLFSAAKSTVLVAPLLAAAVLASADYGSLEWWLSLSMVLGPLAGVGGHAIAAYGTIGGRARRHVRTAAVIALLASALLGAVAVLSGAFGSWRQSPLGPVSMQGAVVCLQMFLSARLKALGKGAWASLVESTLYVSLLLALCAAMLGMEFLSAYGGLLLLSLLGLAAGVVRSASVPSPADWGRRNFVACLALGSRFMAGGLLMATFMAMPRILLGYASPDAVARFALVFRWMSVAVVAHQFVNTVFFRQLFAEVKPDVRDRMLALLVGVVGTLTALVVGFLLTDFPAWVPSPADSDFQLQWVMAIAMVLWSTTASLEGWLYRSGHPAAQARSIVAGLAVLAVAAIPALKADDPVLGMSIAWVCGLLVMIAFQLHRLARTGIRLPLSQGVAGAFVLLFAFLCIAGG